MVNLTVLNPDFTGVILKSVCRTAPATQGLLITPKGGFLNLIFNMNEQLLPYGPIPQIACQSYTPFLLPPPTPSNPHYPPTSL